jgi:hypothetical protein
LVVLLRCQIQLPVHPSQEFRPLRLQLSKSGKGRFVCQPG